MSGCNAGYTKSVERTLGHWFGFYIESILSRVFLAQVKNIQNWYCINITSVSKQVQYIADFFLIHRIRTGLISYLQTSILPRLFFISLNCIVLQLGRDECKCLVKKTIQTNIIYIIRHSFSVATEDCQYSTVLNCQKFSPQIIGTLSYFPSELQFQSRGGVKNHRTAVILLAVSF